MNTRIGRLAGILEKVIWVTLIVVWVFWLVRFGSMMAGW